MTSKTKKQSANSLYSQLFLRKSCPRSSPLLHYIHEDRLASSAAIFGEADRGPLLAISDVHGDIRALETVLNAVAGIPLSGIVAAGDHCFGGENPFEVWQRLSSLGAKMTRGASDFALGVLQAENITPYSAEQEARIEQFLWTRQQLGDLICRRLAKLPTTEVVSMDDRSGVMVVHGSPQDSLVALSEELSSEQMEEATNCIAEDVLVVGMTHRAFVRRFWSLTPVRSETDLARNERSIRRTSRCFRGTTT